MQRLRFLVFLIVFALCLESANYVRGQNNSENLIFNVNTVGANSSGQFTYANQNSSVFGLLRDGNFGPGQCSCYSGTTLNLRSIFGGELSIQGGNPGLVNGNLYNQIFFSGSLVFDGGNYNLPVRYNRSRFNVTLPATLTGFLNGHPANPFTQPTPPIFTSQLSMQGTVKVTLQVTRLAETSSGVISYYKIHQVRYDFSRSSQNAQEQEENLDLSQ